MNNEINNEGQLETSQESRPFPFWDFLVALIIVGAMVLGVMSMCGVFNTIEGGEATEPEFSYTPTVDIDKQPTEPTEVTEPESIDIPEETEPTEVTEPVPEVTEAPVTTEPPNEAGMSELDMLACVIYQEAGADYCCDDCRRRVADVVLNRVADDRYPDTIYEVLTQRAQYGRFYWTGLVWPSSASNPVNAHAVERAYRIAGEVLDGQHSDVYGKGYIGQAEFTQGTDVIYHCGIYFGRG